MTPRFKVGDVVCFFSGDVYRSHKISDRFVRAVVVSCAGEPWRGFIYTVKPTRHQNMTIPIFEDSLMTIEEGIAADLMR